MKKCNLRGQIGDAIDESDLLHKPVKTIAGKIIENSILTGLTLLSICLISPFTWRSVILEAVLLSVVLIVMSKRRKRTSFHWWVVAVVMFLFTSISPFVVAPKPLYLAVLSSENPLSSKIVVLKTSDKTIGSIMEISNADFVRKGIISFFKRHSSRTFRILEKSKHEENSYYTLPTLGEFIADTKQTGDVIWERSIYFPLGAITHYFGITLVERQPLDNVTNLNSVEASAGVFSGDLLDFAYTQYRDTIPWNAVRIDDNEESSGLAYTAYLDSALSFFVNGQTAEAIEALETAAETAPPYNLEAARIATLQYIIVRAFSGWNIGEMQCLPHLHQAYTAFMQSKMDPRFSEKDPLTNWLREVILGGYEDWSWSLAFFDRISILKDIPHTEGCEKTCFDILSEEINGKTYNELLQQLKTRHYRPAELHFIRCNLLRKVLIKAVADGSSVIGNPSDISLSEDDRIKKTLLVMRSDFDEAIPDIRYIDSQLALLGALGAEPYTAFDMSTFGDWLPLVGGSGADEILARESKTNANAMALYTLVRCAMPQSVSKDFENGRKYRWWTADYFAWFVSWSKDASVQIEEHKYPWKTLEKGLSGRDMREQISKFGRYRFIRDLDGKGEVYVPGLFMMTWYAETLRLNDFEQLKKDFEAKTLIPFSAYKTVLYNSHNFP